MKKTNKATDGANAKVGKELGAQGAGNEMASGITTNGGESVPKVSRRVSGTKEWADFTMNCYRGCDNACKYCWALADKIRKNKHKQDTITKDNRHVPVMRDWKLFMNAFKADQRKHPGPSRVMFPSTHDITPATMDGCLRALKFILDDKAGHEVLIVTKPRLDCVKRLCTELEAYKPKILFRFTIGLADDATLKFWEPNASSYQERLECLKYAYDAGYATSISCEPALDGNIEQVVADVYRHVTDGIWIGSANQFKGRLKTNGFWDVEHEVKLKALLAANSDEVTRNRYAKWKDDGKIRWKDELKRIIGLASNAKAGMDR